jgi:hypothetical protein
MQLAAGKKFRYSMTYVVSGPRKGYVSHSVYTRLA